MTEKEQLERWIKTLDRQHVELQERMCEIRQFLGEGIAEIVNQAIRRLQFLERRVEDSIEKTEQAREQLRTLNTTEHTEEVSID